MSGLCYNPRPKTNLRKAGRSESEPMKAIVVTRSGGPEVLQVQDVPGPTPKENQILVNVKTCGINFADILMINGTYSGGPKPPFIAGREFSGCILATGEEVMGYAQAMRSRSALLPVASSPGRSRRRGRTRKGLPFR